MENTEAQQTMEARFGKLAEDEAYTFETLVEALKDPSLNKDEFKFVFNNFYERESTESAANEMLEFLGELMDSEEHSQVATAFDKLRALDPDDFPTNLWEGEFMLTNEHMTTISRIASHPTLRPSERERLVDRMEGEMMHRLEANLDPDTPEGLFHSDLNYSYDSRDLVYWLPSLCTGNFLHTVFELTERLKGAWEEEMEDWENPEDVWRWIGAVRQTSEDIAARAREDDPSDPVAYYGTSKSLGEWNEYVKSILKNPAVEARTVKAISESRFADERIKALCEEVAPTTP